MAEQQQLFNPSKLNPHQFPPVRAVQEGAQRFTGGHHVTEGLENRINNRFGAMRISAAYRTAEQGPEPPHLRSSYESMRKSVNKQYEHMTKPKEQGGMGLQHEVTQHDPYDGGSVEESARHMAEDVRGGRIKTMSTAATGGHAFFSNEENDRFRAVHDVFGHAATGRGFDAPGEEVAYLSHRQMFPKRAIPALTSETRGQNSYLNRKPGVPGLTEGKEADFPEQSNKLVGLPAFASRVRRPR